MNALAIWKNIYFMRPSLNSLFGNPYLHLLLHKLLIWDGFLCAFMCLDFCERLMWKSTNLFAQADFHLHAWDAFIFAWHMTHRSAEFCYKDDGTRDRDLNGFVQTGDMVSVSHATGTDLPNSFELVHLLHASFRCTPPWPKFVSIVFLSRHWFFCFEVKKHQLAPSKTLFESYDIVPNKISRGVDATL